MSFIAWIVLGLVAGFIGSKLVNHSGEGLIRDVLLGVVGAFIGSYLFSLFWSVGRDWAESLQPARGGSRRGSVSGRLSHRFSPQEFCLGPGTRELHTEAKLKHGDLMPRFPNQLISRRRNYGFE